MLQDRPTLTLRRSMKHLQYLLMAGLAVASVVSFAAPVTVVTNAQWEQSLDGASWSTADVQVDESFADWLWPAAALGMEAAYFRRYVNLSDTPAYSAFHYGFVGDGTVFINGSEVVFDLDGHSSSGGVVSTSFTQIGVNEILVTVRPTTGSGFPGGFTGYLEVEGASLVSEPSTLLCVILPIFGLLLGHHVRGTEA
jgi:hypothetical protein